MKKTDNKPKWLQEFSVNNFIMIAGPCSAESEQQVIETALELKKIKEVSVFRTGLWKPRTRPGTFEGIGHEGFQWLKKVKELTGLKVAVEVASPHHVELSLKNNVDIIWIGARTTSNPFSIQEISRSLTGTDICVMVKNPMHPDLNLWIGAIERLHKIGLKRIAGIHRGFFPYSFSNFRNIPRWDIFIELKRLFPTLPVITDPSHIAGKTQLISKVAQMAIDLDTHGLMVEVHAHPAEALSDSGQQFSPLEFKKFISELKFRRSVGLNKDFQRELDNFRSQIDMIDQQLFEFVAGRMKVAKDIGEFKCRNDITILQLKRWAEILKTRVELGKEFGLNEEFTRKLLQLIHEEAISIQSEIMNRCAEDRNK